MRALVVGAGIMGLSAAWALLRRGWEVIVLEQGSIPNPLASSFGQHRLIRQPYGSEVGYTKMVPRAWDAWDLLWQDLGRCLYVPTGTLGFASANDSGWTARSRATLEQLGVPHEILDRDELEEACPWLLFDEVEWGFRLRSGGALLATPILEALARHLEQAGAVLRPQTPVESVDLGRASLVADGEELQADCVIVAAGSWSAQLLPDLGSRLTPSRQVLALVEPPAELAETWAQAPMILDVGSAGFYAVPPVVGTQLKIGNHVFSLQGHPERDRQAADDEVAAVYECARTRFRDFERYSLVGSSTCFYTVEPQERFVVEQRGRGWILAGFSGHGFKFGALMGLEVAAGVAGERPPEALRLWAAGGA